MLYRALTEIGLPAFLTSANFLIDVSKIKDWPFDFSNNDQHNRKPDFATSKAGENYAVIIQEASIDPL